MNALILLPLLLPTLSLTVTNSLSSQANLPKQGDIVYLGIENEKMGFDAAWIVLDPIKTNAGDEGMFLLSLHLVGNEDGSGNYFRNESEPKMNTYAGSDAKAWCENFYENAFDEYEKGYILETHKSDAAFSIKASFSKGEGGPMVDFVGEENILNGDHVFLLSAEEGSKEEYGLGSEEERVGGYKGEAASYWLRSAHSPSFPIDVGIVFYNGWLMDFYENQNDVFGTGPIRMRPALNLKKIDVEGWRKKGEGEWELSSEAKERNSADRNAPKGNSKATWMLVGMIAGVLSLLFLLFGLPPILIVHFVKKKRRGGKTN